MNYVIINTSIISILVLLGVYQVFILFGRLTDRNESYNLYLGLAILSTAWYVFFSFFKVVENDFMGKTLIHAVNALSIWGVTVFSTEFLGKYLKLKGKSKFVLYALYSLITISFFMSLTAFFMNRKWYVDNLRMIAVGLIMIVHLSIVICFLMLMIKNKLFKGWKEVSLYIGLIFILQGGGMERVPLFNGNFMFLTFAPILFSAILAIQHNKEHRELEEYKISLEKKVIERTHQLEKANEQKSNYFVNLAHETKTPLTIIINIFEAYIKRMGTSEELEIIQANLDLLKRNMLNFLDHEKLSKGQVFYNHEHYFNLSKFINNKLIMFDDIARNKQIKLASNIQDNVIIRIDPAAMDRVVNNLLDNAVKFSKFGGNIGVELKKDRNNIVLVVSDNGIGIAEDRLIDIFTPYHQISHNKRNIQGIGMGLAIVKGIMDDVKGIISG